MTSRWLDPDEMQRACEAVNRVRMEAMRRVIDGPKPETLEEAFQNPAIVEAVLDAVLPTLLFRYMEAANE
jgi:hypothetical protein